MESVTKYRKRNEDEGFITQQNATLTQALIGALLERQTTTAFRWVKGLDGHPANEAADKLAGLGARKNQPDKVDLRVSDRVRITGARLSTITQALAYRAIRSKKELSASVRPSTQERIALIISDIEDEFGIQIAEAQLWKSLKKPTVSREARQWIWMTIHDGYMIGNRWMRPNMSDEMKARGVCKTCTQTESMQHILFVCAAVGRETIWALLSQLWASTGNKELIPCWGNTLGAACAAILTEHGARKAPSENLWAILAIESAHLIWKLRCERVIAKDGVEFSTQEVTNRWYAALSNRISLERKVVALMTGLEGTETADWVTDGGVLVGIKRGR
ncbi:hypothetical protein PYCCODRAFT_396873 [Trametes coccinea BRFM310]|uniref:RNase H type-1 domain-containing protein n=1 Tax=Trametes coccinea (strain BRFM310) TaxID=1353009 RepID=A0A1Y2IMM5_TRAC3|nr:hypothetical protein PYCCODRAFT_396873 [Trametes coccinea BRFM310]